MTNYCPKPALLQRFARDLEALIAPDARLGIAVSGGPDSLALLLLAAATRPSRVEAATVDHRLRPESGDESHLVAGVCAEMGVPHEILRVEWLEKPTSAVQERARTERYALLGEWAAERSLDAIVTAHHLDDQAETLVMRLVRGAGVRGLGAMRPAAVVPGTSFPLLRPLLGWRKSDLEAICTAAGLQPTSDPSNADENFERIRIRRSLADAEWIDPVCLASSAANLGEADAALEWAVDQQWSRAVRNGGPDLVYSSGDAPTEIHRRIVARAISAMATEGKGAELRGRELDTIMAALTSGRQATIRGVLCVGGPEWRFTKAAPRRG